MSLSNRSRTKIEAPQRPRRPPSSIIHHNHQRPSKWNWSIRLTKWVNTRIQPMISISSQTRSWPCLLLTNWIIVEQRSQCQPYRLHRQRHIVCRWRNYELLHRHRLLRLPLQPLLIQNTAISAIFVSIMSIHTWRTNNSTAKILSPIWMVAQRQLYVQMRRQMRRRPLLLWSHEPLKHPFYKKCAWHHHHNIGLTQLYHRYLWTNNILMYD